MHEPHDPKTCPACGSTAVVHGRIGYDERAGTNFYPKGLGLLRLERSVRLMAGARFFACPHCDLVWSNAVPGHLARLVGGS
jgi:hypothetical protein